MLFGSLFAYHALYHWKATPLKPCKKRIAQTVRPVRSNEEVGC